MSRLVLTQITIKKERSISSTTWYYLLQPADASAPDSTNYGNPPPTYSDTGYSGWSTTEPTYTVGDNRVLYVMVQTLYSDGTFSYSTPTISSSYEAAKDAYNEVVQAEATIGEFEELGLKRGYIWDNMTYVAPSGAIPVYPIGTYIASGMLVNGQRSITHSNSNTYGLNTWISTGGINLRYNAIDLMKLTTSNLEFYYPSTSSQQKKAISLGTNGTVNSLAFYGFNNDNKTMELTNDGLYFYNPANGTTELASFTSDGLILKKGGVEAGTKNTTNYIYIYSSDDATNHKLTINNHEASDWRIVAGKQFGVDKAGNLYTNGANITNINADNITSGSISANVLQTNVVSAINATANKINAQNINVDGSLIVGANDVATAINDIDVGSRNLLIGSDYLYNKINAYSSATLTKTIGVTVSEWSATDATRISGTGGSDVIVALGYGLANYIAQTPMTLTIGETYSFSIYVKNNHASNAIRVRPNGSSSAGSTAYKTVNAGEAKLLTWTWTASTASNIQFNIATSSAGDAFNVTFWHPMYVVGNKATSWNLAPEDTVNIGGTNLFGYGSDCQTSLNGLNNTGFSITTEDGVKCAHATGALTTTKYLSSKLTYTPRPMETFTYSAFVKIKNIVRGTTNPMCEFYFAGATIDGTWRGFSVDAIYIDGAKVSTTNIGFDRYITDTNWHHVAVTAHFNYDGTSTIPDIRPAIYLRDCTGDLYFHHVKLERGNKATDWSFAPDDSAYITKITDNGIYISPSSQRPTSGAEGDSVKIDGTGMEIFLNSTSIAKYGDTTRIGKDYDPNANDNESHLFMDYHSLQLIDLEGDYYLYISDRRNSNGVATLEANFLGDGETIQFDVGVNMSTLISAVDSSNPSNVGSINATTPRYLVFQNAPADGAQVTITFTTTDQGAKAYTLGTRDTTNDVLGASSVVLNRLNVASGPDSCASGYYTVASGNNAHTEGNRTIASANNTHAEGYRTIASGNNAHAEGGTLQKSDGTIIYTTASGYGSHAEGAGTIASKQSSHAEGTGTTASGHSSHAEGYYTTASASNSHAEGGTLNDNGTIIYTIASGTGSHAEGLGTTASRQSAHAEGGKTKAIALSAHAEGNATTASGQSAHAEGMLSVASGSESHAEGYETTASGKFAHSQNLGTIAQRKSQTTIGEYNVADTSGADETVRGAYALIVGNGTASARSNALTVDWDGDITIKNHSSPIGTMLSYTSDEISCATGKYYQLAYLELDAGVWMIDYVAQFPNTNTTGIRDTFVTTATSGYNNVTTSPSTYGVVTRDRRKGEAHIMYCKSSFPVNITSTITFRLIGYQNSGQTNSVLGRMYAVRIA